MKKALLLTILIIASVQFTFAQNATIAKFKFEEAEQAFSNEDYEEVLYKLKEVETLLGSSNPKVLYLQILSLSKIVEKMPYSTSNLVPETAFGLIEEIRLKVSQYSKEYGNLPDNEDKFRDIYKISEKIKIYPNTKEDYYNWGRPLLQLYYAQYIKDKISVAMRDNKSLNFVFEVIPEKYDYVIINGKQYNFDDLYPVVEGQTFEQWKNRCQLKVQENGSILYNGIVFLTLNNKKDAQYVFEAIEDLQALSYEH